MRRGLFVTFEGPEGSGKSTQIVTAKEKITSYLSSLFVASNPSFLKTHMDAYFSQKIVVFREPGGAPEAEKLRKEVLSLNLTPREQCDYFLKGRSINVEKIIGPGLEKGHIVLCDRFDLSTYVYQSRKTREEDYLTTSEIQAKHIPVFRAHDPLNPAYPDATVIILVDPQKGLDCEREKNVFSDKGLGFHIHVASSMGNPEYVKSVLGAKRDVIFIDRRGLHFEREKAEVAGEIFSSLEKLLLSYYARNEKDFLKEITKSPNLNDLAREV